MASCGLAALAGAMVLGAVHPAWAADVAAEADAAATVAPVDIDGKRNPLNTDTGLATAFTTVQDTPQAISVIDAAQLRNQGINTLEQALRNVPGITVAIGEGGTLNGDQFKIRGFDSKDDVYIDGLRDFGVYTRDSFNYEEVQVLKGPSGAMFGRGTTGGAINTISKRPRLENFQSVDLYAGNGDYYRALADINRRFGEHTAGRLSLMASSTGVVDRDMIFSHRWGAAATAAFGIGTDTELNVSFLHQHDRRRPDYGIIIVQRPGEIGARPATEQGVGVDRSNFLGFSADKDRSDADILTVRLSHRFNDKVSLTSDTRYGVYSRYFQYSTLDQCLAACITALFDGNPATEGFGGIGGGSPYDNDAWGLQNISTIRMDYDLGPLKNQAIFGIDLSRQENDKNFYAYTLPAGIATRPAIPHPIVTPNPAFPAGYALFRPVAGAGGNITCPATGNCTTNLLGPTVFANVAGTAVIESHGRSSSVAAFFTDRMFLTDQLSVIGSLRLDRYTAELDSVLFTGAASPPGGLKSKSTLKSPRISVVFEPSANNTFYASWGRSETPQGTSITGAGAALAITTRDLEPEVSRIIEAGAKVQVPGTQLSVQASVFDIRKNNALQTDPATGFLPSIGRLEHFSLPENVRTDAGVEVGDAISPFYDPMIAKLIAHAPNREQAIADLAEACAEVEVWPVRTNAGFLVRCLETPDFIAGAVDTGLIGRDLEALTAPAEPSAEALATAGWAFREGGEGGDDEASPWIGLKGFRLNAPATTTAHLFLGDTAVEVELADDPSRMVRIVADDEVVVFEGGEAFLLRDHPPAADAGGGGGDGAILAPMPGRVTIVSVKAGDTVVKGQPLLTLEAMKMEHALNAPFDGVVEVLATELGAQVAEGATLVRITKD